MSNEGTVRNFDKTHTLLTQFCSFRFLASLQKVSLLFYKKSIEILTEFLNGFSVVSPLPVCVLFFWSHFPPVSYLGHYNLDYNSLVMEITTLA